MNKSKLARNRRFEEYDFVSLIASICEEVDDTYTLAKELVKQCNEERLRFLVQMINVKLEQKHEA